MKLSYCCAVDFSRNSKDRKKKNPKKQLENPPYRSTLFLSNTDEVNFNMSQCHALHKLKITQNRQVSR
jgi:hypothetical protein